MVKLRRSIHPHGGRLKSLGGSRIVTTKKKQEAPPPDPPELILTIGPRVIAAQADDILTLDYLITVDPSSDPAATMTVELKRTDTSAVVASQNVIPPIAPGAAQTISLAGVDSVDGLSALDFQVCVVTDIGTALGTGEPALRFLFDFDSTAVGAISPSITDDGVATPIFTPDGGLTWDLSALPGGTTTVTSFVDALANVSAIDLDNVALDLTSTPYAEIQSTNTASFTAQNNAIASPEVVSFTNSFAAAPYTLIADFRNNDNEELAAAAPTWVADINTIQAASGDVLIGNAGVPTLFDTGVVAVTNKWIGTPTLKNGFTYHTPRAEDDILEFDLSTGSLRFIASGDTGNDKWSGGPVEENDKLYSTPVDSDFLLEYTQLTDSTRLIPTGQVVNNLWDESAINVSGVLYFTPRNSDFIMEYTEATDTVRLISTGETAGNRWAGTGILVNGKIYWAPRNSSNILEYTILTDTVRLIPSGVVGGQRFLSAVLTSDNRIVFTPRNSDFLMVYTEATDTVQLIATGETGTDLWGGPGVEINGGIYMTPVDSNNILRYDVATQAVTLIPSGVAGTNKWDWGPVVGSNNLLYFTPRGNDNILEFDPVGVTFNLIPSGDTGANKWDGSPLVAGNAIICTPRNSQFLLYYNYV